MQEDRERGNIASTAAKRKAKHVYADSMVDWLRRAREATALLPRGSSDRAVAGWLNREHHHNDGTRVRAINGGDFYGQTISDLMHKTELLIARDALEELRIEKAIIVYKIKIAAERKELLRGVEAECRAKLVEAVQLGRRLRGSRELDGELLNAEVSRLFSDASDAIGDGRARFLDDGARESRRPLNRKRRQRDLFDQ